VQLNKIGEKNLLKESIGVNINNYFFSIIRGVGIMRRYENIKENAGMIRQC